MANEIKYADVGINLSDPTFHGIYHGKRVHEDDLDSVLERAQQYGVVKMMITGSDLKESKRAIEIAKDHPSLCYATIGIHPCSSTIFTSRATQDILSDLRQLVADSKGLAVAFGEIGLDYDRLFLCAKEPQLVGFEQQLSLASSLSPPLPLFLHSRAAAADFARLLKPRLPQLKKPKAGLVHSFTGTVEEMRELVELGLDIGVNGCSLKTEENLAVVKEIPLERLQIETDGPWCEIRPSHASSKFLRQNDGASAKISQNEARWEGSPEDVALPEMPKAVKKEKWTQSCMVKGRNEPCTIPLVAHVIARVKGISVAEVALAAWANSVNMFGLDEN